MGDVAAVEARYPRRVARRVVFRRYGGVEVLEIEETITPRPGAGEVLVEVAFAGVNFADVIARRGFYTWAPAPRRDAPTCVGFEIAGVVAEVGAGVTSHRVGDRVAAVTRFGGYATHVAVEAERAWALPTGMPLEHGAAMPAVYMTAWHSLVEIARVRGGESILIQAVAGGVGLAALQIAKRLGLVTFGTASSEEKLALARAQGLDHGIDYAKTDFEDEVRRLTKGRGVDVVLDSLGGTGLTKGYRALARAGLELVRGGVFHPFRLIEDNKSIAGVQILLLWDDVERLARGMREIFRGWEEGAFRPHVDRVLPLERAGEAHRALETRASKGKLLLATQ